MPVVTARELIRILKTHGFLLTRQRSSHMIFHNAFNNTTVIVPVHSMSQPIAHGTLSAIIKQSKLQKQLFR
jgi:predicted RNA binding protein YcfA (HicA-like mRNA interferase family)